MADKGVNCAFGKEPDVIFDALVVSVVADGANATPLVYATSGISKLWPLRDIVFRVLTPATRAPIRKNRPAR